MCVASGVTGDEKKFVGEFTKNSWDKRGRTGEKVRGDTLQGVIHPSEINKNDSDQQKGRRF